MNCRHTFAKCISDTSLIKELGVTLSNPKIYLDILSQGLNRVTFVDLHFLAEFEDLILQPGEQRCKDLQSQSFTIIFRMKTPNFVTSRSTGNFWTYPYSLSCRELDVQIPLSYLCA